MTHRAPLNQLNKARVNFKHFGLSPTREDGTKLAADAASFFRTAFVVYFAVPFDSVTLHSLVGHRRTQNWLKKAEDALEARNYEDSITASAGALAIFRRSLARDHTGLNLDEFRSLSTPEHKRIVEKVEKELRHLQEQIDLVFEGVNLPDYRKFRRYAPHVRLSDARTLWFYPVVTNERSTIGRDEAAFGYRFVIDTIMALKETHVPPRFQLARELGSEFEVIGEDDLIVWPTEDPEVIRRTTRGERLRAEKRIERQAGFVSVLDDGEWVWIREDSLREVVV